MTETVKPRRRRITISGEAREQLQAKVLDQYSQGAAIRALADQHGRSYGFIHRLLSEAGAQFRPRGGNNREARKAGKK